MDEHIYARFYKMWFKNVKFYSRKKYEEGICFIWATKYLDGMLIAAAYLSILLIAVLI